MAIVNGRDIMAKYSKRLHIHQRLLLVFRCSLLLATTVFFFYNLISPCNCFFPSSSYLRYKDGYCDHTKYLQWFEAISFGGGTVIHMFFVATLITWINVFGLTIFQVYNWYLDLAKLAFSESLKLLCIHMLI